MTVDPAGVESPVVTTILSKTGRREGTGMLNELSPASFVRSENTPW